MTRNILQSINLLAIFVFVFGSTHVFAQDDLATQAEDSVVEKMNDVPPAVAVQTIAIEEKAAQRAPDVGLNTLQPLLFLTDEYELLQEAKASFVTRPPRPGEIDRGPRENVQPGLRELSLAGIVYRSQKDWTIWFNEQRVTPDAIPSEVLDLRVNKDYIQIKWYDEYTNQIFPIRLRPHQRFNLDTRIFLPG
ncbi:MAG: hypothetical protein AAF569_06495 [Pseudomonadota bacterium]